MKAAILPVTPLRQNCSLIWCEKTMRGAVVDPGGDLPQLKGAMEKTGMALEKILCTHGHLDHVGGVADLAEETGVPVEGPHKDDKFWIDRLPADGPEWGLGPLRSFTPDRWLEHGDEVTVGEEILSVLHCPGHTPGHVVFFNRKERVAFVGDVLFQGSVGRTDFPRGDPEQLLRSITTNLWPLGNDVTFVPGHGPLSTFGGERQSNPYVADHVLGAKG